MSSSRTASSTAIASRPCRACAEGSVGFILTDPPYLVNYRDRIGRTVMNDDNARLAEARLRARCSACCGPTLSASASTATRKSTCSWMPGNPQASASRAISSSRKNTPSSSYHTQYRHEQAYLLAKGWPRQARAARRRTCIDWTYTGNKLHPTQKPVGILQAPDRSLQPPGDTVLDPFCGSGSTLVAARELGRRLHRHRTGPRHHGTASPRS